MKRRPLRRKKFRRRRKPYFVERNNGLAKMIKYTDKKDRIITYVEGGMGHESNSCVFVVHGSEALGNFSVVNWSGWSTEYDYVKLDKIVFYFDDFSVDVSGAIGSNTANMIQHSEIQCGCYPIVWHKLSTRTRGEKVIEQWDAAEAKTCWDTYKVNRRTKKKFTLYPKDKQGYIFEGYSNLAK
jgi:hypothetical protein